MQPEFRQFAVPDDFPRLVELKNAYLAPFGRTTTEERQRFLLTLRDHNATQDNRVIVDPDDPNRIIGHIWVWQQTRGRVVYELTIHPTWQQQGLGSQLLDWAIGRAKTLKADYIDVQVDVSNTAQIRFVQKHSFLPLGTYLRMTLKPDVTLPAIQLPDAYRVRSYQGEQDFAIYTMLMNTSYGDLWGYAKEVAESEFRKMLSDLDPEGIFLLFTASGEPIGVGYVELQTQISLQDGSQSNTVDAPGVVPSHRHPDTYRALLLYSLYWVRERLSTPASIVMDSWGDFDSTVEVFWEIGFEVSKHAIGYRLYL